MDLTVKRRFKGKDYTIGSLLVNGNYFCDTLEDTDRGLTQSMYAEEIAAKKIMHQTAIPTGRYKVIVDMSPAKGRLLPRLQNVPGFTGILIHRGNTPDDTSGCILIGENKAVGKVLNSTVWENRLLILLTDAQKRGEEIFIWVINDGLR